MKTKDRHHFDTYREQTRVKHIIVEKYISAFFTILKKPYSKLYYIDGFAGKGTYNQSDDSKANGSPLRALEVIANSSELANVVTPVFIEKDDSLLDHLKIAVQKFLEDNKNINQPRFRSGNFNEKLNEIIDFFINKGKRLPPTFLLVDPCGVDGVSFNVLKKFLDIPSCEVFMFFNIDGLRRIVGLKNQKSETLITLLGSEEKASELIKLVDLCINPEEREVTLLQYYLSNIKENTKVEFVAPFRVEFEDKKKTSHYLLHITSHKYGFRIMKDIMWSIGQREDGAGGLEFSQASLKKGQLLFDYQLNEIKSSILDYLNTERQIIVSFFTKHLVEQPDNLYSTPAYKEAIKQLENEGKVWILAKNGSGVLAKKRKKNTLADDYYVSMFQPTSLS